MSREFHITTERLMNEWDSLEYVLQGGYNKYLDHLRKQENERIENARLGSPQRHDGTRKQIYMMTE